MAVDAEAATIGLIDGSTASLAAGRAAVGSPGRRGRQSGPAVERADQVLAAGRRHLGGEGRGTAETPGEASLTTPAPAAGDRGRPRRAEPAHRPRAGDERRLQLRPHRVQPGHPGAAPAGLGVQALRLSGRAGGRLYPVQHPARRADRDRPGAGAGQVEAGELLEALLRAEHAAPRHREVAQRDDRPPRPGHRHGPHPGNGDAVRPRARPGPEPRLGSRLQRGHPAPADDRLCHAGQRRQTDRAGADRAHPGPATAAPSRSATRGPVRNVRTSPGTASPRRCCPTSASR